MTGRTRVRDRIITADEAAELLRVNPQTVYQMIQRNELPCARVGRLVRVRESDVLALFNREAS
jgi:excisionase family DNA binding protein